MVCHIKQKSKFRSLSETQSDLDLIIFGATCAIISAISSQFLFQKTSARDCVDVLKYMTRIPPQSILGFVDTNIIDLYMLWLAIAKSGASPE